MGPLRYFHTITTNECGSSRHERATNGDVAFFLCFLFPLAIRHRSGKKMICAPQLLQYRRRSSFIIIIIVISSSRYFGRGLVYYAWRAPIASVSCQIRRSNVAGSSRLDHELGASLCCFLFRCGTRAPGIGYHAPSSH